MNGPNTSYPSSLLPVYSPADLEPSQVGAPTAPPSPTQEPLKKLFMVMRGRWAWGISLGLGLALLGGASGYWFGRHKLTYTSTGVIHLFAQPERLIYDTPETRPILNFDRAAATQAQLIKGTRVLGQAANSPELAGVEYTGYPDVRSWLSEGLQVTRGDELIFVNFTHRTPKVAHQGAKAIIQAYRELESEEASGSTASKRSRLNTQSMAQEQELGRLTAKRANLTDKFKTRDIKKLHDRRFDDMQLYRSRMDYLRQQLAGAGVDVKALDTQLEPQSAESKAENPMAQPTEAPAEPAQAQEAQAPEPETELSLQAAAELDDRLGRLIVEKGLLEQDLEAMRSGYGDNHREVKRQKNQILFKEKQIQDRFAEVKEQGWEGEPSESPEEGQVENLKLSYAQVRHDYQTIEKEVGELAADLSDLDEIDREIATTLKLRDEAESALTRLNFESGGIERVEIAGEPEEPHEASSESRRRLKLLTTGGLVFGGGLGFGIVFLIGFLDHRLRSLADTNDNFVTTPVLGIVPTLPTDISDPTQAALGAHCVHQIRTLLQIGPSSQGRRVFTITSASPQDGKTSLTLSLGLSYAASGSKTLLVDCDLGFGGLTHRMNAVIHRRIGYVLLNLGLVTAAQIEQALHITRESGRRLGETLVDLGYLAARDLDRALGMQERTPVGILDAISGVPLDECVAETGIENLHILPIGSAGAEHVARLSPLSIRRLLEQARAQFDVVLVDTGSVLGGLEASHMAVESDGVVLVVSRGGSRDLTEQGLSHLHMIGAKVSGIVFNRAAGRDVQIIAERSAADSVAPYGRDNGHPKPGESSERMGPLAGAVVDSSRVTEATRAEG